MRSKVLSHLLSRIESSENLVFPQLAKVESVAPPRGAQIGGRSYEVGGADLWASKGFNSGLIIEERLHTVFQCSIHLAKLLVLVLGGGSALLAFEEGLAVLVELKSGDNAIAGVNGEVNFLGVGLGAGKLLNVKATTATVHGGDLTFTSLVGTADNLDRVALTHGDGADRVLLLEVLNQVAGHHSATNAGGGGEVSLTGLSALAGYTYFPKKTQVRSKF